MKHLLIAVYIFSVLYCYLQLNTMIDQCLEIFQKRHPTIPMDTAFGWKGFVLTLKLLAISAIPIVNLLLGYAVSVIDEHMISEIVLDVEIRHMDEIKEFKKTTEELLGSDRQEPITGDH